MVEEETRESAAISFQDYGRPIKTVTPFKYFGRVMTELDNDGTEVVEKLRKA